MTVEQYAKDMANAESKKAREEALAEGEAIGEENEKKKTVFRLLERNKDDETICLAADISLEELENYRKEYNEKL